jgi:hypothetical protein
VQCVRRPSGPRETNQDFRGLSHFLDRHLLEVAKGILRSSQTAHCTFMSVTTSGQAGTVAPQTFQPVIGLNSDTAEREIVLSDGA